MQSENNSVMAVFETVAESGVLTRAEISALTGFSRVTVGKAVDLLDRCGIVTQKKRASESVGRKSDACSLVSSLGMIIFELSAPLRVHIADISLDVREELSGDDLGELAARGFARFGELIGGELMGIACIAPNDDEKYRTQIREVLGMDADITISASRAYAIAAARRLDALSDAIFLRLHKNGTIDGAFTFAGKLYTGAHGRAGDFSRFDGELARLGERIAELVALMDPEIIHISCKNEDDCAAVETAANGALEGISADVRPRIIVEPSELCPSAADGAVYALREYYIRSKLPKNT